MMQKRTFAATTALLLLILLDVIDGFIPMKIPSMIPTSSSLPSIVDKNAIDMSNVCLPENLPSLQQPSDDVYGVYCNRELNMER